MENNIQTEKEQRELNQIRENSKDEHWTKKYGVTAAELNEAGNDLDISARIIKANLKNKAFAF